MTNHLEEAREDGPGVADDTPRRRSSDKPPALDYSTRELVKHIVDGNTSSAAPRKSFLRKLLERETR